MKNKPTVLSNPNLNSRNFARPKLINMSSLGIWKSPTFDWCDSKVWLRFFQIKLPEDSNSDNRSSTPSKSWKIIFYFFIFLYLHLRQTFYSSMDFEHFEHYSRLDLLSFEYAEYHLILEKYLSNRFVFVFVFWNTIENIRLFNFTLSRPSPIPSDL